MAKIKYKHTSRTLHEIGKMIKKGLQQELVAQKHVASGKLKKGLKYEVNGITLDVYASVSYWQAVNNPKFARIPNILAIKKWMRQKNLRGSASAILNKLKDRGYGKPYVVWAEGNRLRRTDFAGHTARKFKGEVSKKLAPSIGVDVANAVVKNIRKNYKQGNVVEAF